MLMFAIAVFVVLVIGVPIVRACPKGEWRSTAAATLGAGMLGASLAMLEEGTPGFLLKPFAAVGGIMLVVGGIRSFSFTAAKENEKRDRQQQIEQQVAKVTEGK